MVSESAASPDDYVDMDAAGSPPRPSPPNTAQRTGDSTNDVADGIVSTPMVQEVPQGGLPRSHHGLPTDLGSTGGLCCLRLELAIHLAIDVIDSSNAVNQRCWQGQRGNVLGRVGSYLLKSAAARARSSAWKKHRRRAEDHEDEEDEGLSMLAGCRPGTRVRVVTTLLRRPLASSSSTVIISGSDGHASTDDDGMASAHHRRFDDDQSDRWRPHEAPLGPPSRVAWSPKVNHIRENEAEHERIVRRIEGDQVPRAAERRSCMTRRDLSCTRRRPDHGTKLTFGRSFVDASSRLNRIGRYFASSTSRPSKSHVCLKHAPKDFDQSVAVYPDFVSTDESKALIKEANKRFGRKKRFQDGHW